MRSGRRLLLMLLAVVAAAFACYLHEQSAMKSQQRKELADLQQRLAAQIEQQKELNGRVQAMREELHRIENLRKGNRNEGDHWLPGELDRLRNDRHRPAGEA
jgi:septal ring factor EnvC (AmiA/AmiB activator)